MTTKEFFGVVFKDSDGVYRQANYAVGVREEDELLSYRRRIRELHTPKPTKKKVHEVKGK